MKKPLLIVCLALALAVLTSCSEHARREPARNAEADLSRQSVIAGPQKLAMPLESSLEQSDGTAACLRLKQLAQEADQASAGKFSYLGQLYQNDGSWFGSVEVSESPLTQFVLGESFTVPNWDEFYKQAQAEYAAGKLSGMKWFLLHMMNYFGLGGMAEASAVNGKLAEAFPGIFGDNGEMAGGLHWQIALRTAKMEQLDPQKIAKILTTKMPLFPGNGSWKSHAENSKNSLSAALRGLQSESEEERLCALVLLHQNFAQLLRSKGHLTPVVNKPYRRQHPSWVEKLSSSQSAFPKEEQKGVFFDLKSQRRVRLRTDSEANDIKNYNPATNLLTVTADVPGKDTGRAEAGSLGDALAFMEAMLYSYEASSPAASWTKRTGYLFGDINDPQSHAILPAEAHQLALGLLLMQFKNLSAVYVKKINSRGILVQGNEAATGIVLADGTSESTVVQVRLEEAMRLAHVVSYLEVALRQLKAKPADEWYTLNPVYDRETLAALLGREMFTEEELSQVLQPAQRATVLHDGLVMLKLPLVLLMSKLATSREGCFSRVEWNLSTGNVEPVAGCSPEQKQKLADIFELMARETKSPLLLQKAEELRR